MARQRSMGLASTDAPSHLGKTTTWLTPKHIIDAFPPFDLDPCAAPKPRPWATADRMVSLPEDGLAADWHGVVWLNPPYTRDIGEWTDRLVDHGRGVALVFARTDAAWWRRAVRVSSAVLFLPKRVTFCDRTGKPAAGRPATPSCLIAFGPSMHGALRDAQAKLGGIELRT